MISSPGSSRPDRAGRPIPRKTVLALVFSASLLPALARAQLATGEIPRGRTVPTAEALRRDVERSRFRLGPLRLIPVIEVNNVGYDSNVLGTPEERKEEKVSDWTVSISAGLDGILPLGSKLFLRLRAIPQYTWYRELENRRIFGGLYEGSFLALFNRLSLEATGATSRGLGFVTSETETQVLNDFRRGAARAEVEIWRGISLFASTEAERHRYEPSGGGGEPTEVDVDGFDRTESAVRGGIRFRLGGELAVSAAVERTRSDFVHIPEERDNESRAYLGGIYFSRPRFFINLNGGYREGRPRSGSSFPEYSTATGSYFVSFFPIRILELKAYGRRRIAYSGLIGSPAFIETRNGGGVNVQVGPRLLVRTYGEIGTNDYPFSEVPEGASRREVDVQTYGGGISTRFFRGAVLTAGVTQTDYRSNIAGEDRSVLRFTTGISFHGEFVR